MSRRSPRVHRPVPSDGPAPPPVPPEGPAPPPAPSEGPAPPLVPPEGPAPPPTPSEGPAPPPAPSEGPAPPPAPSECPAPSDRPAGAAVPSADLAPLFECPVCFGSVLPPIFQCYSGHLLCNSCRPRVNCCPTCRGPLGRIPNLAMNRVADYVLFPCQYAYYGCMATMQHHGKAAHEDLCAFRPYRCPCPSIVCPWRGPLHAISAHLTQHEVITSLQGAEVVFLAFNVHLPGALDWVMVQSCHGCHFMTVLGKRNYHGYQQFFSVVQFIGAPGQAQQFTYQLKLAKHRRYLAWQAVPLSLLDDPEEAFRRGDCLLFDTGTVQYFAEDENLSMKVSISMG
ncbi:E3 ubiquitin-protein ligase Siah1-like [Molossus molossus]|uniref:E3 ubiquitin-protein ligase Siah1-like n=1 Tax=Molossus molossus TaxID=27622 RepID=UPI001746E96B|nr:E3 ubiquitin-protein ligase Siah1-like [Molossus molossus]